MELRQAAADEWKQIMAFYDRIIDAVNQTDIDLRWVKGVHPDPDFIRTSLEEGSCLVADHAGSIVAAAVLNHGAIPEYAQCHWTKTEEDGPISYLHVYAVAPEWKGSGLSVSVLKEIVEYSRKQGDVSIHLDVKNGNFPAAKLYPKAGFRLVERMTMVYPTTGPEQFDMFEYIF